MNLTNYRDVSRIGSNVNAGFQFEFHCGSCSRTWKSSFEPYRRGQIAGLIYRFAYYIDPRGGSFRVFNAVADAGTNRAREGALRHALEEAERHYTECPSCAKTVCEECWDPRARICAACAGKGARSPNGREDASSAESGGAAAATGVSAGPSCPNCASSIGGGRFCPECGFDMASTHKTCPGCGTLCARAARFCPDCGHGF